MSDDLVKRLWLHDCEGITREAADRIEELEGAIEWQAGRAETAEAKLVKAVEGMPKAKPWHQS